MEAKRTIPPRNLAAALLVALLPGVAHAQAPAAPAPGSTSLEDVLTRRELERRHQDTQASSAVTRRALEQFEGTSPRSAGLQGSSEGKIVNGVPSARYPTTGALLKRKSGKLGSWCSGTLIGCNTFLTAGHCVARDPQAPELYQVFLQHGGWRDVATIASHPEYVHPATHGDLALLKLKDTAFGQPVTPLRIVPTAINKVAALPFDTIGTIVGFGRTGGTNYQYGLKREGGVRTATCAPWRSNDDLVCWNFDAIVSAPGENSNTCNVDSGGPLFVDGGGGKILLGGVTSGGTRSDCMPSDLSYDSNVFTFRNWIQQQAAGDIEQAACGAGPQVTQDGTRIQASYGELSAQTTELQVEFPIGSGRQLVRVAINGTEDDVTRFDYFVRLGSTATATQYDCMPTTGQYAFCEFANPQVDRISVLVRRQSGTGGFLVAVTEFD